MGEEEFYSLTWWQWGMKVHQINRNMRHREIDLHLKRMELANFINANRGKNDPPIKHEDIIRLSIDDDPKEKDVDLMQATKKVKEMLGGRIKHGNK